jgi:hypothetical protein
MLLHEPAPQPIPDIVVEMVEDGASSGAEAIIVAPATQEMIEPLELVRQRQQQRVPPRELLDSVPRIRLLVLRYLDPRHESKLRMPLQSNSLTEELKSSTQVSYPRLLIRQRQPRGLLKVVREGRLFGFSILACP